MDHRQLATFSHFSNKSEANMWKFFKSSPSPSAKEAELAQEVAKLGAEVRGYRDLVETVVRILSELPKRAERVELSHHIPHVAPTHE